MNEPSVRVLLVEDDEDDFIAVQSYLRDVSSPRFEIEWAATYEVALDALSSGRHDICLLDYRLGEHDGLDLLRMACQNRSTAPPVIFLTGYGNRSLDVEAMKAGACDYLSKDRIDSDSLERSIRYAIANKRAAEALERAYEELERKVEQRTRELKVANENLILEVAERKRAEAALQAAHDELELRVLRRTVDLANLNEELQVEIKERKRVEEALKCSERELRHLSSQLLTAQEEERKRIARDLHDSIGSSLSAIKLGIEYAAEIIQRGTVSRQSLLVLASTAQRAIDDTRRIMTDLRPSVLDDCGIIAGIGWHCRQLLGIKPALRIDKEIDIEEENVPEALKVVIFRIIQEAFHNIVKHSNARRVKLCFQKGSDSMELLIADDGKGFDPTAAALPGQDGKGGFGLSGMRERAGLSGGSLG